jgi:anti-sigma factor RsiW
LSSWQLAFFHDLVDHELRIPPHVDALDAYLDGDLEAAKQGLVLSHIFRCGEAKARSVPHVLREK